MPLSMLRLLTITGLLTGFGVSLSLMMCPLGVFGLARRVSVGHPELCL